MCAIVGFLLVKPPMSASALRMIRVRRLSTTGPAVKRALPWRDLICLHRGCVFITYEVVTLNQAVTINTSAILQEKHKSYIYLTHTTNREQENFTIKNRKEIHKADRKFLEISSRVLLLPLDGECHFLFKKTIMCPHECALWVLLKKTRSADRAVRQQAVQELAQNHHWQDYQYQTAAQVVDQRTAVALARMPNVDLRFFLPPAPLPHTDDDISIEDGLRQLLASLPQSEVDQCVQYFTSLALRESSQSLASQRVQSHCDHVVANGGLLLLQRVYQLRRDSPKIQRNIVRIIGNLTLNDSLHTAIVQSGWVAVLAEMIQSPHIMQASHAARALANLDRDAVRQKYQDGVYILHPQCRTNQPIKADVLFVHGLLGAAFKTWRQKDLDVAEDDKVEGVREDYTECWPKVRYIYIQWVRKVFRPP
uniref:Protein SERAC1 n=1 Tax=Sinocyclocheilus rhinocerous TaxID=307959 RepID=A0A673NHL3_9TELE